MLQDMGIGSSIETPAAQTGLNEPEHVDINRKPSYIYIYTLTIYKYGNQHLNSTV